MGGEVDREEGVCVSQCVCVSVCVCVEGGWGECKGCSFPQSELPSQWEVKMT